MNFAERLVAGPPVLATVGRRAVGGDIVVLALDAEDQETIDIFEVVEAYPALVGQPGVRIRSLIDPEHEIEVGYRLVTVLTQREAKEALKHVADLKENA